MRRLLALISCFFWLQSAQAARLDEAQAQQWVADFLRCDERFSQTVRAADPDFSYRLRKHFGGYRYPVNAALGKLWLDRVEFERSAANGRLELRWKLIVEAPPEETFAAFEKLLPQGDAPIQTVMKRNRPQQMRLEISADGRKWQSIELNAALDKLNGKLPDQALRVLYFGRIARAVATDLSPQKNSVLTSVQCELISDAPELASELDKLADWPLWLMEKE